jgi:UDP-N-acetylmuramoyl-tripeptide--D-alanyl-D-alanine ligase
MLMTLGETASVLNQPLKRGRELLVSRVSIDSREIHKGSLFIAIRGERFDGHEFVAEAFRSGAVAAVVEAGKSMPPEVSEKGILFAVPDPVRALQDLAAYYRCKFLFPIIAVTGTNGKTTTKEMIAQILSTHYQVMKTEGNLNNHLGVALTLFSWSRNGDAAVVEMGTNHFGEIRRLCEIARPTHGVITNIGKGHLEFLVDEAGVARAKAELLESLAEKGLAFLNGDDPYLIPHRKTAGKTITFGFGPGCDLTAKYTGMDRFGFPKMEVDGRTLRLSIPGRHNLYNALAAAAVGRAFGIPWAEIQEKLWQFHPVERRMELARTSGILFFNDTYNANPSSVEQALATLKDTAGLKRRIVVLGDMLELGRVSRVEHEKIGERIAALGFDGFWCTGEAMRHAAQSAQKAGMPAAWRDSRSALAFGLSSELREGDGVLIKGSRGMHMEEVVDILRQRFEPSERE